MIRIKMWVSGSCRILVGVAQQNTWFISASQRSKYGHEKVKKTYMPTNTICVSSSHMYASEVYENEESIRPNTTQLDFENVERAFASKTKMELLRSIIVLHMCSYNVVVDNALKLMKLGHMMLGKRLFTTIMRGSFYGQFVAGETSETVGKTVTRLASAGIGSMIHITAEDSSSYSDKEKWYEGNVANLMDCLSLQVDHCDKSKPMITHIKQSSFSDLKILDKLNVVLQNNGCNFDNDTLVNFRNFANGLDGNLKPIPELSEEENRSLSTALLRFNQIAQASVDCNIILMVDAEYYSTCAIMAMITLSLMSKFNREKVVVCGTYQAYLKEAFDNMCRDAEMAKKENFGFGFKLVRGAYMQLERALALKHGCQVPINDSFEDTSDVYTKCMKYAIKQIRDSPKGQYITMFGTHNEDSVKHAIALLEEAGIDRSSGQVFFGQLLGMCDHVSYSLGDAEYLIYKSVPYGPIEDVMPNMSRRAAENKTVFSRLDKEKKLVTQALKKRILN